MSGAVSRGDTLYFRALITNLTSERIQIGTIDSLLIGQSVTFASVKARGASGDMVVRVEVLIDGEPPRDGAVRYYRMSHSAVTGWRLRHEVHAWTFYTPCARRQ